MGETTMRIYHCHTMREALTLAFDLATTTGITRQIGSCGDPYGWDGYAVIDHEGHFYPGIEAPASWCWVAEVRADGSCDHHSGYLARWDAEIARARNHVAKVRSVVARVTLEAGRAA
jgi:hypothetical protein